LNFPGKTDHTGILPGLFRIKEQKTLIINGTPDRIHFFIGMKSIYCVCDQVREMKKSNNDFINESDRSRFKFIWQVGYGAFSYSIQKEWPVDGARPIYKSKRIRH